jgi:sulfatase maturation enzyme AslB (radical SAM superfamily)
MCDGESSSSIKSESFKINNIANQTAIIELDKVKVFDFLNEHLNSIDKIYFAGGEPLIMEEHYELLDLLITNNKTDITLSYNTNLSTLTYKDKSVIELWSKFKIVELYASLDGIFEIGEYIRDGLNYKKFEDNIFSIIKNCKHVTTSINICVNIFNVFHLFEMLPYVYEKGILNPINFTINILTTPYYQSVTVLPNELKVKWVERLEDFKTKYNGIEYTKIRHELDVIKNYMLSKDDSEYIKQFNDNVIKYDLIRNKDFFKLYNNLQPIV